VKFVVDMDIGICRLGQRFIAEALNVLGWPIGEFAQGCHAQGLESEPARSVDMRRHGNAPPLGGILFHLVVRPLVQRDAIDDMAYVFETQRVEEIPCPWVVMKSAVDGLVGSLDVQFPPVRQLALPQGAIVASRLEIEFDVFKPTPPGDQMAEDFAI
jgi:hypothetical protein